MLINKHNLEIIRHIGEGTDYKGRIINTLQITATRTIATNGFYSVAVTALEKESAIKPVCISKTDAEVIKTLTGEGETAIDFNDGSITAGSLEFDTEKGEFPYLDGFKQHEPGVIEFTLDVKYLLAIAESLSAFQGDIARVRFLGEEQPICIDSINVTTGQKWSACLMPRRAGIDKPRFEQIEEPEPPAAEEDEFARAIAEAAKLAGL
jgi:hypothetical protein